MTQQQEADLIQSVKTLTEEVGKLSQNVHDLQNPPAKEADEKPGGFNHNHFALLVALVFLPVAVWAFWGSLYEMKKFADVALRLSIFHILTFGFYWVYNTTQTSTDEAVFNTNYLRGALLIAYGLSIAYILQP